MAVTADKSQRMLMFVLPLIFVPFIISFPAGLILYWITTNVWTIGQQFVIQKVIPTAGGGHARRGGGDRGDETAASSAAEEEEAAVVGVGRDGDPLLSTCSGGSLAAVRGRLTRSTRRSRR